MKHFFKILLAVGAFIVATQLVACNCGKTTPGGNNSNNNSNNNSGGSGGGNTNKATIVIENVDATIAELKGDIIELKASGFPATTAENNLTHYFGQIVTRLPAASIKRAFDITITDAASGAATGGLILVGPGSLADANAFSFKSLLDSLSRYTSTEQLEGIISTSPSTLAAANGVEARGFNIYGLFMNHTPPNSQATAASSSSPFAFSATAGRNATQPFIFCRTVVPTITDQRAPSTGATGTVQNSTTLAGGQKASCYVAAFGEAFTAAAAHDWLNSSASARFKKRFDFAVAGIKTDAKTIADIGLPGTDKAAAFHDGITTAEMAALTATNPSAYKKFSTTIVRDAGFNYVEPPTIVLHSFDRGIATLEEGRGTALDTIKIRASAFPANVTSTSITDGISTSAGFSADRDALRKAFEITIRSAGRFATGGLIMVGGGNIPSVNDFFDQSTGTGDWGSTAAQKQGYSSGRTTTLGFINEAFPNGWSHYGAFMNETPPNSAATAAADAAPFAFTPSGGSQPYMFCAATIPSITSDTPANAGGIKANTTLAGGQNAECYVASKGNVFNAAAATTWLGTGAGNTFKKTFNIAIGGFITDGKTVSQFMPGANDTARVNALNDGLSSVEIAAITAANPSAYKKVKVIIVSDTDF